MVLRPATKINNHKGHEGSGRLGCGLRSRSFVPFVVNERRRFALAGALPLVRDANLVQMMQEVRNVVRSNEAQSNRLTITDLADRFQL